MKIFYKKIITKRAKLTVNRIILKTTKKRMRRHSKLREFNESVINIIQQMVCSFFFKKVLHKKFKKKKHKI